MDRYRVPDRQRGLRVRPLRAVAGAGFEGRGMNMHSEHEAILSDLLAAWHQWARGEQHSRGYSNSAPGMDGWRCSRQYDFDNGQIDAEVDKSTCKTIDFHVGEMKDPYRAAIYMDARNLAAGRQVFQSPRVPTGIEGANILKTARAQLILRLVGAGVI